MMRALIIDDEKRAINILKILIEQHVHEIDQIDTALGSKEGLAKIQTNLPDLIFLDVEMPGMTGFEMLEELGDMDLNVIFTTAYDHYAIRAIRFSAIDYLLKPIDIQDLKTAVRNFVSKKEKTEGDSGMLLKNLMDNLKVAQTQKPRLAISAKGGAVFFDIDEIIRCEADNNYTTFYLQDGNRFLSSKTLREYEDLLSEYHFIRTHQSHIVNPAFVKAYTQKGMIELKDGHLIPVARRKHHWVQETLKKMYS
jgi:two-component system LytT family response regulator